MTLHLDLVDPTAGKLVDSFEVDAKKSQTGAGADFSATPGTSGLTVDQKFRMNWDWMKSCMNTSGGGDDGNVGYGWSQGGYDSWYWTWREDDGCANILGERFKCG